MHSSWRKVRPGKKTCMYVLSAPEEINGIWRERFSAAIPMRCCRASNVAILSLLSSQPSSNLRRIPTTGAQLMTGTATLLPLFCTYSTNLSFPGDIRSRPTAYWRIIRQAQTFFLAMVVWHMPLLLLLYRQSNLSILLRGLEDAWLEGLQNATLHCNSYWEHRNST